MPVCLHCGEIGPDGALFCAKCGYTLPQSGTPPTAVPGSPPGPAQPPPPPPGYVAPAAVLPPRIVSAPSPTGPYMVAAGPVPGAVGPVAPPPNAKYCRRCGTLISTAAVYCPVCQQPQA